jgi:hypothetical protein
VRLLHVEAERRLDLDHVVLRTVQAEKNAALSEVGDKPLRPGRIR